MSRPVTEWGPEGVRQWAEAVLRQLDVPAGATLRVAVADGGDHDAGGPEAPAEGGFTSALRLTDGEAETPPVADGGDGVAVTLEYRDGTSVTAFVPWDLDQAHAVTELADRLQDSVLESTGGLPTPPCPVPGHPGHPAVAEVVDGTACWTCPTGGPQTRPVLRPRRR